MAENPEPSKYLPNETLTQLAKNLDPSDFIDDQINDHILPRLPVKYLIRFTSVCKTWESLIKSSQFMATNLKFNNRPESKGQSLILSGKSCYTVKNRKPIFLDKLGSVFISNFGSVFEGQLYDDCPAESCNGLILLKIDNEYGVRELLWNPSIKKCKTIDVFYQEETFRDFSSRKYQYTVRGLGFLESTNDYRVITTHYDVDLGTTEFSTKVEIYSLSSESWRNVDSNPDGLIGFKGGVFLNGCVHWLATRKFIHKYEHCVPSEDSIESILFFDFEKECFGEFKLPENFDYRGAVFVVFKKFQGSLAAIFYNSDEYKCFVWVMVEYGVTDSWNKKITTRLPKTCGCPLGFINGTLVCHEDKQEESHTQSTEKTPEILDNLIFLDNEKFEEPVEVIDYIESLALQDVRLRDDEDLNHYLRGKKL